MEGTNCSTCANLSSAWADLARTFYQHIISGKCHKAASPVAASPVVDGSMEVKITSAKHGDDLRQVLVVDKSQGEVGHPQYQRNTETSDERVVTKTIEQKLPMPILPTLPELELDASDIPVCDNEDMQLLAASKVKEWLDSQNTDTKKTEVKRAASSEKSGATSLKESTSDYYSNRPMISDPTLDIDRPRSIVRRTSELKQKKTRKREPVTVDNKQYKVKNFILEGGSNGHLRRVMYEQDISSRMKHHLDMVKRNRKSSRDWRKENVHAYFLNNENWAYEVQNHVKKICEQVLEERCRHVSVTQKMDMVADVLYPESILFALMNIGKCTMKDAEEEYRTPVSIKENRPFSYQKEKRMKKQ